jgi:hypothetical protein
MSICRIQRNDAEARVKAMAVRNLRVYGQLRQASRYIENDNLPMQIHVMNPNSKPSLLKGWLLDHHCRAGEAVSNLCRKRIVSEYQPMPREIRRRQNLPAGRLL